MRWTAFPLKMMTFTKENDINTWEDILCSWIGRMNIIKMTEIFKTFYGFNVIPVT